MCFACQRTLVNICLRKLYIDAVPQGDKKLTKDAVRKALQKETSMEELEDYYGPLFKAETVMSWVKSNSIRDSFTLSMAWPDLVAREIQRWLTGKKAAQAVAAKKGDGGPAASRPSVLKTPGWTPTSAQPWSSG